MSLLLAGKVDLHAQSPIGVEREIEEAQALYRQARLPEAIAKLRAVVARLEELRELGLERVGLGDACVRLALRCVELGEPREAKALLKAALLVEGRERRDPRPIGPGLAALLEEARAEMLAEAATRPARIPAAALGALSVSAPVWLEVRVDDGPPLETPVLLSGVAAGRHTVRASRRGKKTAVFEVEIPEGGVRRLGIVLEPE